MPTGNATSSLRRLAWPGQLLAWSLVIMPLSGLVLAQMLPGPEGAMRRVRLLGLLADGVLLPIFGLFLAAFLAEYFQLRRTRWVYAVLNILAGVVMLVAGAMFLLDVIEVRRGVQPDMQRLYALNSLRSVTVMFLGGAALLLTGLVMVRGLVRERRPVGDRDAATLVGSTLPRSSTPT